MLANSPDAVRSRAKGTYGTKTSEFATSPPAGAGIERPSAGREQPTVASDGGNFFERLENPLIGKSEKRLYKWDFPFSGQCGEFEALIPVGDPSWVSAIVITVKASDGQGGSDTQSFTVFVSA